MGGLFCLCKVKIVGGGAFDAPVEKAANQGLFRRIRNIRDRAVVGAGPYKLVFCQSL